MIVGTGMIAKAFSKQLHNKDIIIFASGVSNSQEVHETEFQRELQLLQDQVKNQSHLVYFSSTSIYDESVRDTPYVIHKLSLEKYIQQNFKHYTIYRLPIVVGNTNNPTALVKLLCDKITNNEPVHVFKKACRYFLDVDDLVCIVNKAIELNAFTNEVVDMCITASSPITDVILTLEYALGKQAKKIDVDKGGCYAINNERMENFLKEINFEIGVDYNQKTLIRYSK